MNEKPSGRDAHLAEKKLAVNSTARARKSRKRLFVLLRIRTPQFLFKSTFHLEGGYYED